MKADEDYLWDGTGDPDPDVQRLEGLLSEFRHKAPAPAVELPRVLPFRQRRRLQAALLAVAAVLVTAFVVGVTWRVSVREEGPLVAGVDIDQPGDEVTTGPISSGRADEAGPTEPPAVAIPRSDSSPLPGRSKPRPRVNREVVSPALTTPEAQLNDLATVSRGVDTETATHFERAKLLLMSFENARSSGDTDTVDVSYERERSKALLSANRALRRNAEASGNLPIEDALAALEPFLVDISNLDADAKKDDVATIQTRLEQRGIDSDLQLYAANRRGAGM
jgi:hypothetical protein